MPDQDPISAGKPFGRYRCTFRYADHVTPPAVPGAIADRDWFADRAAADQCLEIGAARTDIGRMTLEQSLTGPGELPQEWGLLHEWVVTPDGWRLI